MFDFDQPQQRKNTNSVKFDVIHLDEQLKNDPSLLPMWVADMDFATDKHISQAISNVALHGIYGYSNRPNSYNQAIIQWYAQYYQYHIDEQCLTFSPCVMTSIAYLIEQLVQPGQQVIIQSPVYPEFASAITNHGAIVLENPLIYDSQNSSYTMNFALLEQQMQQAKVLILCSPHNPVGRVWTKTELQELLSLAIKYQVKIISDEIHCDLTLFNHQHHVLATINSQAQSLIYTLISASKTFNLAAIHASSMIFPNALEAEKFNQWLKKWHINRNNIFSLAAVEAAYIHGRAWLEALKAYLATNIQIIEEFVVTHLPLLKISPMQATYLMWVDCRALNLNDQELKEVFYEKAKLVVNMGESFGTGGSGFIRINIATTKANILLALERLQQVYQLYL